MDDRAAQTLANAIMDLSRNILEVGRSMSNSIGNGAEKLRISLDGIANSNENIASSISDHAVEVEKVSDLGRISSYGVLMTPGLVINGKVYLSGKLPAAATLKGWIEQESK